MKVRYLASQVFETSGFQDGRWQLLGDKFEESKETLDCRYFQLPDVARQWGVIRYKVLGMKKDLVPEPPVYGVLGTKKHTTL